MNWRLPLALIVLTLLGWLMLISAIEEPVTPDEMDIAARKPKVIYGVGE